MSISTKESAATSLVAWTGAIAFGLSLCWFLYCYFVVYGAPAAPGQPFVPIAVNLALFSVFALHHSLFARTSLKHWIRQTVPPELERSVYTWVASILLIITCELWRPVPGVLYRLEGVWSILGYGIQVAGVILTLLAGSNMDFLDLAGVRQVQHAEHGVAPRHVELQTRGMYRFVRHPLYFAWVLLVFGAPTMTATRAVFAIVSSAYLVIAIPFEERGLDELFGPAYSQYRSKVRWRMIPGVF